VAQHEEAQVLQVARHGGVVAREVELEAVALGFGCEVDRRRLRVAAAGVDADFGSDEAGDLLVQVCELFADEVQLREQ